MPDPDSLSSNGAAAPKHCSIDFSLELERQLDMEGLPPTPIQAHSDAQIDESQESNATSATDDANLDPHVLTHIVKQLQQSLEDVTKDKNELQQIVASSHAHEAELQDALQHMIDKATTMEVELSDAKKKIKDDEEAIVLLRSKVEESRRGLMRLQTENRRQSQIVQPPPLDLASRSPLSSLGSPPSGKRSSFAPLALAGNTVVTIARPQGHRRISSVSDSLLPHTTSPPPHTTGFPDTTVACQSTSSSRRHSGLYGRTSPVSSQGDSDQHSAEVEALRKQVREMKEELENVRHELRESNEGKEASETCVRALREFIAEHNIGVVDKDATSTSIKLPPPPMMAKGEEDEESNKTPGVMSPPSLSGSSWGFRLWKDTSASASATSVPQGTASASTSPFSRKIGGLFGGRNSVASDTSSVVSVGSTGRSGMSVPQLQTNAAMREETYSISDGSSVVEPISPAEMMVVKDLNYLEGTGTGTGKESVIVGLG